MSAAAAGADPARGDGGSAGGSAGKAVVRFHFDVVCPYAYIASTRVGSVFPDAACVVKWTPTLLGGLYRKEPQGSHGSATAAMSQAKRRIVTKDLFLQAERHGVPLKFHPGHPLKTLSAMRLLVACPEGGRAELARKLYRAYWVLNENLEDEGVLGRYAAEAGVDLAAALGSARVKQGLADNTALAANAGAFGVPCVFVERAVGGRPPVDDGLFWGGDRLHFAAASAGLAARLPRVQPSPNAAVARRPVTVRFYYDTASPWSFLGLSHLARVEGVARVEAVPVLVGAIFRATGGPMLPAAAMSEAKRAWSARDLALWQHWHHEHLRWPDTFPLRTVLAQRCIVAEPGAAQALMRAAWQRNLDLSSEAVVRSVLSEHGFDADAVVARAGTAAVKDQLRANTDGAVARGVMGVPSSEVLAIAGAAGAGGGAEGVVANRNRPGQRKRALGCGHRVAHAVRQAVERVA